MFDVRKRFRKDVSGLFGSRNMLNIDIILHVDFVNIVIFCVDMFRAGVLDIIFATIPWVILN